MNSKKITCLAIIICVFLGCVSGLIIVDMPIVSLVCAFMIPVFGFKEMMLIRSGLTTLSFIIKLNVLFTWFEVVEVLPLSNLEMVFLKCYMIAFLYAMSWAYVIGFYFMFKKRLIY